MAHPDGNATVRALEALLDEERGAALDGRLDVIEGLGARKMRLAADLADAAPGRDALARLRRKAERNGELLTALRDGVDAARTRLAALRDGAPLQTYSETGERRTWTPPSATGSHRV